MDILVSPLPLFNEKMEVEAYFLKSQKGNKILEASMPAFKYDGAFQSPLLEFTSNVTLEALTYAKPIFLEITSILLALDLSLQTKESPSKIVFILDKKTKPDEETISNIKRHKKMGFRFAMHEISNYKYYSPLMDILDFFIFHAPTNNLNVQVKSIKNLFKHIKIIVLNISSTKELEDINKNEVNLFQGNFYKVPVSKSVKNIEPVKLNYLKLIEMVNSENYEIDEFSKYISQDPALAFEFLRMVNSTKYELMNEIKTIKHAANMLGEDEVVKWISTAVTTIISKDRPSEITRLSLIRARFSETLSELFGLENDKESLFLMGLFSILNVVLDTDIKTALELIAASENITDALANKKGPYFEIYDFITHYELGDWQYISRILIVKNISIESIYDLYVDVVIWYSNLINWVPENN